MENILDMSLPTSQPFIKAVPEVGFSSPVNMEIYCYEPVQKYE